MLNKDRTFDGAIREIHRLCGVISGLKQDNKFLQEMWEAVAKERNDLQLEVARLKHQLNQHQSDATWQSYKDLPSGIRLRIIRDAIKKIDGTGNF